MCLRCHSNTRVRKTYTPGGRNTRTALSSGSASPPFSSPLRGPSERQNPRRDKKKTACETRVPGRFVRNSAQTPFEYVRHTLRRRSGVHVLHILFYNIAFSCFSIAFKTSVPQTLVLSEGNLIFNASRSVVYLRPVLLRAAGKTLARTTRSERRRTDARASGEPLKMRLVILARFWCLE